MASSPSSGAPSGSSFCSSRNLPSWSSGGSSIGYWPGEAGGAELRRGLLGGGDHALRGDVAERVGAERRGDLVDPQAVGDELGAGREVDAVEAGPLHRRRADAHVHLGRAGLAQHPDERALGVAAHDRVVDDHQALAADDVAQRVELEPDAELAQRLRRLDERAADVGVLGQALAERDAGLRGVADGGGRPGLRHRDDQVGLDGVLAREACGPSRRARRARTRPAIEVSGRAR